MPQPAASERRIFLITLAVFVLLIGALVAVLVWAWRKDTAIKEQIESVNKQMAMLDRRIDQIPALEKKLSQRQAESAKILALLPESQEVERLVDQINNEAVEAGTDWTSYRSERVARAMEVRGHPGAATGAAHDKFICNITITGKFEQFVNFLHRIEYTLPRFIQVETFRITGYKDGLVPGTAQHRMEVKLVTYAYAGKPAPAPASPAAPAKPAAKEGGAR